MLNKADLDQFYGSENHWKWSPIFKAKLTDGAKYVAEKAGAYWLMNTIAAMQLEPGVKREEFQVWELKVDDEHKGVITCEDGNGKIVYTQGVEYTDFPLKEIKFYFQNNVIMLPSEY